LSHLLELLLGYLPPLCFLVLSHDSDRSQAVDRVTHIVVLQYLLTQKKAALEFSAARIQQ
jgi:hypothetical protein